MNRVKTKVIAGSGTTSYSFSYLYDIIPARGDVEAGCTAETTTDPKLNKTTKIYDRLGRIKYVINGGVTDPLIATYQYYDNGNKKSVTYPNNAKMEYTYWNNNLLKTLSNYNSNGTRIEYYTYNYDEANNLKNKTDNKGTTSYTYDELNRLKTVLEPSGKNISYEYDAGGNRTTETVIQGGNTTVSTYIYDNLNMLEWVVTNVNGVTYEESQYI